MPALEVILFDARGRRAAAAEPDVIADSVFVAQTLWDDASASLPRLQGASMKKWTVGFYVDGKLAALLDRRPSS